MEKAVGLETFESFDFWTAGQPITAKNCSVAEPPVYFRWEEPEPHPCGCSRSEEEATLEDVLEVGQMITEENRFQMFGK